MLKLLIAHTKNIIKLCVSGLISLFVLSLFCLFYKYTGSHMENVTKATDYKWKPKQYIAGAEEGFGWMRVNGEGFNNTYDRPSRIDVLLMGSSNIEGFNVAQKENVSYILSETMPELSFYNIGVSGHYIDVSVDNLEDALEEYQPNKYVVIETNSLDLSSERLKNAIDGQRERQISKEGLIASVSRYIPSMKMLYLQINNWRNVVNEKSISDENYADYQSVKEFLQYAHHVAREHDVELIILYHPETILNVNGGMEILKSKQIEMFSEICQGEDVTFLNLEGAFQNAYDEKHILAHGFINTKVGAGHLNKYGHKIIAEELAQVIKGD